MISKLVFTFSLLVAIVLTGGVCQFMAMEHSTPEGVIQSIPLGGNASYRVVSVAFSPDGSRIVAGSSGTAYTWDVRTGKLIHTLIHTNTNWVHSPWVNIVKFSPDSRRIVTVSVGTACIWDAGTGELIHTLIDHKDAIVFAEFSPDGNKIVTRSISDENNRVTDRIKDCIWDTRTGELKCTFVVGNNVGACIAKFSPDSDRVVTVNNGGNGCIGWYDCIACVWDANTGKLIHTLTGHRKIILSVKFSPDGSKIVTASDEGKDRVWDAGSGELIHTITGHPGWFAFALFSPDGGRLATSENRFDKVSVWDARRVKQICTLTEHKGYVNPVQFSPDDDKIVTDGTAVRIWDARTGEPMHTLIAHADLDRFDQVEAVKFSPDGGRIVTAHNGGTVCLWRDARIAQRIFALALARHDRLGADSAANSLQDDVLRIIAHYAQADSFGPLESQEPMQQGLYARSLAAASLLAHYIGSLFHS